MSAPGGKDPVPNRLGRSASPEVLPMTMKRLSGTALDVQDATPHAPGFPMTPSRTLCAVLLAALAFLGAPDLAARTPSADVDIERISFHRRSDGRGFFFAVAPRRCFFCH